MNGSSRVVRAICVGAMAGAIFVGCAQGPSIKQRADEAVTEKKQHKEQEEFTKSLPPTEGKPIYQP